MRITNISLDNLGDINFIVNVPDEDYYAACQEDIVQARRRDRRRERQHMRGGLVRGGRVGCDGQVILAVESVEDDEHEDEAEVGPDQATTTMPSRSGAPYNDVGSSYHHITDIGQSSGIQYGDVGSSYHHITDIGQSSGTQYSEFFQFSGEQSAFSGEQYVTPSETIYHSGRSPIIFAPPHIIASTPRPTFNNEPVYYPVIDFQTKSPFDQYGMGLDLQLASPTAPELQEEGGNRPLRRSSRPHVAPSCGTHSRRSSISPPPATLLVVVEGTTTTPTVTIPNPDFELKEQLHNIQKGGDSMQKYLDFIVKIVAALDRAKSAIPEQNVILCVLRGLPSEYSSIKQNIRTNIVTVTFAQVSSWLLTKELTLQMEQRIQLRESTSSTEPHTTFYVGRGRGRSPDRGRGANALVTPNLSRLYSHTPYSGTETLTSVGGHPLPIAHVGSGKIPTASGIFHLGNLLHVPSLKSHRLSVYRFPKDKNGTLVFNPSEFQILDNKTHRVRYRGPCEHGLYMLPSNYQVTPELSPSLRSAVVISQDWHRRLGHPSLQVTNNLLSSLGSSLSDTKYAGELIHRAGVDSPTTTPTPINPNTSTNDADTPFSNPRLFRSLVGGLQYLIVTRPDIQYAMNYVAQKMHNPADEDFHTLKRILRYVKGTLTHGLEFGRGDMRLRGLYIF
nr:uncharacterized protein LOC112942063 [Ipomoea batatas]